MCYNRIYRDGRSLELFDGLIQVMLATVRFERHEPAFILDEGKKITQRKVSNLYKDYTRISVLSNQA